MSRSSGRSVRLVAFAVGLFAALLVSAPAMATSYWQVTSGYWDVGGNCNIGKEHGRRSKLECCLDGFNGYEFR